MTLPGRRQSGEESWQCHRNWLYCTEWVFKGRAVLTAGVEGCEGGGGGVFCDLSCT